MRALSSNLRKQLETAVLAARRAAESASRAALDMLGVFSARQSRNISMRVERCCATACGQNGASSAATASCWSPSVPMSSGTACYSPGSSRRTTSCCTRSIRRQ